MQIDENPFQDAFFVLETFETGLNALGYIPVIGNASASIRKYYSVIEAITGVALLILSCICRWQREMLVAKTLLSTGATFLGHAVLNWLRAHVEEIPGLPLVTTLPYDICATYFVGKRFFSYS